MKKAIIYLSLIILMASMLIITATAETLDTDMMSRMYSIQDYNTYTVKFIQYITSNYYVTLYTPKSALTTLGKIVEIANTNEIRLQGSIKQYKYQNDAWTQVYSNLNGDLYIGTTTTPPTNISWSNTDLYYGDNPSLNVFFSPPKTPPLNLLLEQNPPNLLQLLNPLKVILPILVGGIVLFLSFRKAWQICRTLGMRA